MSSQFTYTDENSGTTFQWHGGEYIDVGHFASPVDGGEFVAVDCINVWDHADDKPRIERTLSAFKQECDAWLYGDEEDDE